MYRHIGCLPEIWQDIRMRDIRDNIWKTPMSAYDPNTPQSTVRSFWKCVLSICLLFMLVSAGASAAEIASSGTEKQLIVNLTPVEDPGYAAGGGGTDYSTMLERPVFATMCNSTEVRSGDAKEAYRTISRLCKSSAPLADSPGETSLYEPPFAPELPNPAPGTEDVSINTTLNWTGQDMGQYPLLYEVYFGTSPDALEPVAGLIGYPGFAPGPLEQNTTYYWQVYATDGDMYYVPGGVWNYTTGSSDE